MTIVRFVKNLRRFFNFVAVTITKISFFKKIPFINKIYKILENYLIKHKALSVFETKQQINNKIVFFFNLSKTRNKFKKKVKCNKWVKANHLTKKQIKWIRHFYLFNKKRTKNAILMFYVPEPVEKSYFYEQVVEYTYFETVDKKKFYKEYDFFIKQKQSKKNCEKFLKKRNLTEVIFFKVKNFNSIKFSYDIDVCYKRPYALARRIQLEYQLTVLIIEGTILTFCSLYNYYALLENMLFLSEVIAYIYKMSLLLNNVSLNNFTQTPFFNFEKEEENNGKKCGKLSAFKTKN